MAKVTKSEKKDKKKIAKWRPSKGSWGVFGKSKKAKERDAAAKKAADAAAKKAAAKKKADESWTKAVKEQKKQSGGSETLNQLIKQRNAAKKGSVAYAKAQNAINKAYGVEKRHKAAPKKIDKPKKVVTKKPITPVEGAAKKKKSKAKTAPKKVYSPLHKPKEVTVAPKPAPKAPPKGKASYEETSEYITSGDYKRQPKKALGGKVEDYNKGGKVAAGGGESNPYGWPSRDARNGGKG